MTDHRESFLLWPRRVAFGIAIAICVYGYTQAWPIWILIILVSLIPAISFCMWVSTGRLKRYRMLFGIYGAGAIVGSFEAWQYDRLPESLTSRVDLPKGPGEPDLFLQSNFPSVLFELYPERSEVLFLRGFQIQLCLDENRPWKHYTVCDQFAQEDLNSVRDLFAAALQKKSRTDENLYYHFVEVLMRLDASEDEIDQAADEWKRIFPTSNRPDPRTRLRQAAAGDE